VTRRLTIGEARAITGTTLHRARLEVAASECVGVDAIDARRRSVASKADLESIARLEARVLRAFAAAHGIHDLEEAMIQFLLTADALDAIRLSDRNSDLSH